jgi:glycosyltransferase involved in cell wall biosynthesis
MHILIIPSFYPEKNTPVNGLFFKNQSKVLVDKTDKVGTVYTEQKSLKKIFSNISDHLYQTTREVDGGILTYRTHGISLLNQFPIGAAIWIKVTLALVKKYIEENGKPDVIHAHNVFNAGRVARTCLSMYGIPYVVTEHDSGYLLNEYSSKALKIATEVFNNSACNIAVSKSLASAISTYCNLSFVKIIPNVVDISLFELDFSKREEEVFKFISVGNLLKNKGHEVLIRAFSVFQKDQSNVVLEIYGEGPEHENLDQLIKELNLMEAVSLKGKIAPKALVKQYQLSHCLVLPSFKETFGVVIIEAMACGLPVIATRSGGPEDIINDDNGILVDPGDIESMAKALRGIKDNHHKYNFNNIRKFVEKNYSENIVANSLLTLYKTIAG